MNQIRCELDNITAVFSLPVRHEVNLRGESLGELTSDKKVFDHYECRTHNCTFRQWPAVLSHLGIDKNGMKEVA